MTKHKKMKNNKQNKVLDMPHLNCPFIRKMIRGRYVVTPEIDPVSRWVFDIAEVKAIEKMDGTSVSVVIKNGDVTQIYNRTNKVSFWSGSPIVQCLLNSAEKKWLNFKDGQYFGEAVGEKIQANPLNLKKRIWMPFELALTKLMYTSFYTYERTFENWSSWFKEYLFSLMARKYAVDTDKKVFAEGVVFYHPDGVRMAKLRRDMFSWYKGKKHKEKE